MIEPILQTNSTVTTTILQQTDGASFFDWITNALFHTAATDWIMVAVTCALAYYAYVTIEEGRKDRRRDSIEKQLERLYNPLFEFLTLSGSDGQSPQKPVFIDVEDEYFRTILAAFQNYGHYLNHDEHDSVKRLVSEAWSAEDGRTALKLSNIDACLPLIAEKRAKLKRDLETLG